MQRIAKFLTYAGALPFLGLCLVILIAGNSLPWAAPAMLAYAAVILSFLGGIEWGIALAYPGDDHLSRWAIGISVFPALGAWVALFLGGVDGLWVVAIGLLGVYWVDRSLHKTSLVPAWFLLLRFRVTSVIVPCVALSALRLSFA